MTIPKDSVNLLNGQKSIPFSKTSVPKIFNDISIGIDYIY